MFKIQQPNSKCKYEVYRRILNTEFNISFGYPRKDTCSKCDELNAKIEHDTGVINTPNASDDDRKCAEKRKSALEKELEVHLRKAQVFYDRKKQARVSTKTSTDSVSVAFDY